MSLDRLANPCFTARKALRRCTPRVRAQTVKANPCATARAIWVFVLPCGSSLIALSCTPIEKFPTLADLSPVPRLKAGTPGKDNEMTCSRAGDQRLKLADGGKMEIGHPTTNTLPTRMICTNHDSVAKRKKNSSVSSRHSARADRGRGAAAGGGGGWHTGTAAPIPTPRATNERSERRHLESCSYSYS
jgi:hypothetical protein